MKKEFVHCHLHSEYSLLDSSIRVKDIVNSATEKGMDSIALTDHGVMYGAIEFYLKAKSAGLKPLIGCEAYVATKGRMDKTVRQSNHLVLIAQNATGYKNLVKLVSIGFTEGFYYKPRVDHEMLKKYSEGLIVLSACLGGEVASALLMDDYQQAKKSASFYKEVFKDNYYLEIQDHGMSEQRRINPDLVRLSKDLNIKLVATNDCHYTNKDDALARNVLTCIQSGKKLEDNTYKFEESEFYIKSPEEMYEVFSEIPYALTNTLEIAEKCNLIIPMGKTILPSFPLPAGHTPDSYLRKLAMDGLKKNYKEITHEIMERFDFELNTINTMGFPAYFLIVWDYINYARSKGIQVGPGRGSAAGSIIAYALGITNLDPLPYNLLFERFLNPERVSMPDIDTDFCIERRDEVYQYVGEKYGHTNVSQIVTLGTLGAKQVIRDVSKVLGFSVAESDRLSKMIPTGIKVKLKDGLEEGLDLKKEYDTNSTVKQIVDISLKLEGLSRHSSIHAAGVVIAKDPIDTIVPLQRTNDGNLVTQYQMTELEKLGLLKMDFLGLRNLTMIANSLDIIEKTRGFKLDVNFLSFDDKKTYELLSSGETVGVFQLESPGMRKLVKDLEPNLFEEIIALLALYRPGPLGSGMVKDFVERKHGRSPITYPHPSIENILKDTYGLIVYQEQIMQISQIIGGYTLGQADLLRRAMGKKKLEEMTKQKQTFLEGASKKGIDSVLASDLFATMEKFAEYGFNKSHSAAYAVITYQTAYLKANYPIEYMAALVSSVMSTQDKVPFYIAECKRMGIKILQPDVNSSEMSFSIKNDCIVFGLKAVKGVGENVILEIIEARKKDGEFKSLYDFCKRVSSNVLNKRALEALVKAGGFDSINKNRRQLFEGLEDTYLTAFKKQKQELSGQTSLFGLVNSDNSENTFSDIPVLPKVPPYSDEENLKFEKDVIGLYVSGHPLDRFTLQLERFSTHAISELSEERDGISVTLGGIILNCMIRQTKKMANMAIFTLEDLTGTVEVIAYPDSYNKYIEFISNDVKVLLHAKLSLKEDDPKVFVNSITPLSAIPYFEIKIEENAPMEKLLYMRNILQEYSGDMPVILAYPVSNIEILTSKEYWIKEDEKLFERIKELFGEKSVSLKK